MMKRLWWPVAVLGTLGWLVLATVMLAEAPAQQNAAQYPSFLGSGVAVTQAGTVRIDLYQCYIPVTQVGAGVQTKPCPVRVEFGEDVPETVLVCRSSATGQVCAPLGKLLK